MSNKQEKMRPEYREYTYAEFQAKRAMGGMNYRPFDMSKTQWEGFINRAFKAGC